MHNRTLLIARMPVVAGVLLALLLFTACTAIMTPAAPAADAPVADTPAAADAGGSLVVYSGRNENLVGPLLEQYQTEKGIDVEVRYGSTAEMAATILEEGANSPADVFFGQDAGALGALSKAGRCAALPESITGQVDPRFASPEGTWVGVSGRARVLVYNTNTVTPDELPASMFDLTLPEWKGRIGWAPTNASFQSFVTAIRLLKGEDVARQWLVDMIANDVQTFSDNTPIVEAVGRGEIDAGLVNHYYLFRFLAEDPNFPVAAYHFPGSDPASMINVAGACVLDTAPHADAALEFVTFLLSQEAQQYFADNTYEYPLAGEDVQTDERLIPLADIQAPDLDLSDIDDLQGTLTLLQEVGALQ